VLQASGNTDNTDYSALIKQNAELKKTNADQKQQIDYLQFELLKLKKLFSGSKSERFISQSSDNNQTHLGFQVEAIAESEVIKTEVKPHERVSVSVKPKNHKGRNPFPDYLKREKVVLEPENKPEDARQIGVDVTETLEYVEATLFVKRVERPKYVAKDTEGVMMAAMPNRFLGRSMFGNSFAAQAIVSKYVDHQPEHRQLKALKRQDIHVPSSSFNDIYASSASGLTKLHEVLGEEVFSSNYLQADETPNRVLTNEKPGKSHQGYYWAYRSPEKNLVFFDYREGRSGEGPRDKLQNFSGTLQCDGFSVYDQFGRRDCIELIHCWAHARRKFKEASDNNKSALEIVELIQALYQVERIAREKNYTAEQRLLLRQQQSVPLLEEIRQWLNKTANEVLEKDPLAKAIAYTVKRWNGLTHYLSNGLLEIDNNWVENSIRPLTLGRKNFLFAGSHEGAKRSALFYSFMGTCHLKGVNPYKWLKETMDKLPFTNPADYKSLLP
jgi:transposase